tara:strand:+ start:681 stop:1274 length:594 start_codon:yes stop_codon:yes gene_type:complete
MKNTSKKYKKQSYKQRSVKKSAKKNKSKNRTKNKIHRLKPPLKSSFKKKSKKIGINWSPDVKQIERSKQKKEDHKISHFYLKIGSKKTQHIKGYLHASYLNKKHPIVSLTLRDNAKNIIAEIRMNYLTKNIIYIMNDIYNIGNSRNGNIRVRIMFKFGNILWSHGKSKICRCSSCQGFDVSWLSKIREFYSTISRNS